VYGFLLKAGFSIGLLISYPLKKCNKASHIEVSHKSNGMALSNETTKEYNPVAEPHGSSLNDHGFESVSIIVAASKSMDR